MVGLFFPLILLARIEPPTPVYCTSTVMGSEEEALTEPGEIVEAMLAEAKVVLGAPGVKKLVKELKVTELTSFRPTRRNTRAGA